jgi:hypothetical protein
VPSRWTERPVRFGSGFLHDLGTRNRHSRRPQGGAVRGQRGGRCPPRVPEPRPFRLFRRHLLIGQPARRTALPGARWEARPVRGSSYTAPPALVAGVSPCTRTDMTRSEAPSTAITTWWGSFSKPRSRSRATAWRLLPASAARAACIDDVEGVLDDPHRLEHAEVAHPSGARPECLRRAARNRPRTLGGEANGCTTGQAPFDAAVSVGGEHALAELGQGA